MARWGALLAVLVAASLIVSPGASAAGVANIAALQVALQARGLYSGTIDGVAGPRTRAGVIALERRSGLAADGIAGQRVRRALGRLGRHPIGSRVLRTGDVGWDVSALQFRLAWHGFPSGIFDGGFGPRVEAAVEGFQRWVGLGADGVAGRATLASLDSHPIPRSPMHLARPVDAAIGDGFGPRGNRFHPGVDFLAQLGAPVHAAARGTVAFAGRNDGYGALVVLRHGRGVTSWYAHLSRITVRDGQRVPTGALVGRVGATGNATGPHLHFEVRVRGASVDPRSAID